MKNLNQIKLWLVKEYPWLLRILKVNYGIDPKLIKEETRETHYIFGVSSVLTKKVLRPDSNWLVECEALENERQSGRSIESMGCTVFSFLNVIEILMAYKFGVKANFSDRWLNIRAGTTRNGNSPTKVIDTARKLGLLPQEFLPNNIESFTWADFYSFRGADEKELDKEALKFLDTYSIGYETVYPSVPAMAEALKYSPLYVAGYAWAFDGKHYYSAGTANHAFVIANVDQATAYKKALDSYDPFIKHLRYDYQVMWPKIIVVNKKGQEFNVAKLREYFKKGIKYLFRAEAHGELYRLEPTQITKVEPQEWLDINIREKAEKKELLPLNEMDFNKLIN